MSEINRRDALKVIAGAGVAAAGVAGCTRVSETSEQVMNAPAFSVVPDVVTRISPLGMPWRTPDPFLFCVHHDDHYPVGNPQFGPAASLEGRDIGQDFAGKDGWRMYHGDVVPGFPVHPHRGFETVTVVRSGLLDHSDSLGAAARYGRGDVQWLTAGKGIQHSEMFPLLHQDRPNPVELFQIWLNLPRADKFADPHFTMFWADTIPHRVMRDAAGREIEVTLVAGQLGEAKAPKPPPKSWAAHAEADVAIWTVRLAPNAQWSMPPAPRGVNRTLYFFKGSKLRIGGRDIPQSSAVDVKAELEIALENGPDETELLMLQGRPIGEPVVQYGPFVMNSREEIQQAYFDYQRTQFGGWPWPRHDPVHGSEEQRFARHADGRVEKPA